MLTTAARSHTLPACLLVMLALAVLGVFPLGVTARYLLITSMAVGVAAVGVDILSGYGGLPFFGQGAFVGIGAYGETILRGKYNLSFIPATILTLLFTVVIAAVVGSVIVRLAHFGAALATFFLAFVVYTFLQGAQLQSLTQGENGLSVPSLSLGSLHFSFGTTPLYIASWLVLLVTVLVSHNYMNSRAGRALRQVKQSELIGGILGIDRWRVKLTAFVYAAVLGAVGGVVISFAVGYISPESFDQQESIYLFAMVAVGGMGSLAGPILGAVLFTLVPNYVGVAGKYQGVVFAVVLLGVLVFFPGGIYGALESLVHGLRARRRGTSVPAVPKLGRARERSTGTSAKASVATAQVKAETTGRSLRIGRLSARYRNVRALQDVSITVEAGAIHAIIGPNGAGKTTLLNCISGVQRAERGEIWVERRPSRRRLTVLRSGPWRGTDVPAPGAGRRPDCARKRHVGPTCRRAMAALAGPGRAYGDGTTGAPVDGGRRVGARHGRVLGRTPGHASVEAHPGRAKARRHRQGPRYAGRPTAHGRAHGRVV